MKQKKDQPKEETTPAPVIATEADCDAGIPKDVLAEVEKKLEEQFKDWPRGMGFCHIYWNYKKQYLADLGYSWQSPQDIANQQNPNGITFFD